MSTTPSTLDTVVSTITQVITAVGPVITAAVPGAGLALNILQGVLSAEPAAVALFNQITGGTAPTAAQLQQYIADNEASITELDSVLTALGAT